MYILLMYDISIDEDGARVWRNIFNISSRYLIHIQKSVFEGEISESSYLKLKKEIFKFIRDDKDSLLIFKSRSKIWLEKEIIGKDDKSTTNFF